MFYNSKDSAQCHENFIEKFLLIFEVVTVNHSFQELHVQC